MSKEWIVDWVYPYKGLNDPKYIEARDEMFASSGHGWWWEWTKLNTPIKGVYTKKAKEDVYHGGRKKGQFSHFGDDEEDRE